MRYLPPCPREPPRIFFSHQAVLGKRGREVPPLSKARPCPRYTPHSDRTFFSPGRTLDKGSTVCALELTKNQQTTVTSSCSVIHRLRSLCQALDEVTLQCTNLRKEQPERLLRESKRVRRTKKILHCIIDNYFHFYS